MNTEENENELKVANLLFFIKNTVIDLYEASNISSFIIYLRSIHLSTQIYIFFSIVLILYSVLTSYFRNEYYVSIFTPLEFETDPYYDISISNILMSQNDILRNLNHLIVLNRLKIGSLSEEMFSIYVRELSLKKFFNEQQSFTSIKNMSYFNINEIVNNGSSNPNYNIAKESKFFNNDQVASNFSEILKLYYLYVPIMANQYDFNNINIISAYLIYYGINTSTLNRDENCNNTSICNKSNIEPNFFQYPMNSDIPSNYNSNNSLPYDFSIDPLSFYTNNTYNLSLIEKNWFYINEKSVIQKNLTKHEGIQIILKQSDNGEITLYRSNWMFDKIKVGDYSLNLNFIIFTDLDSYSKFPPSSINNNSLKVKNSFFCVSNRYPDNDLIGDNKINYWDETINNYINNFDIDTDLSLIQIIPDKFKTLFRYGMINKDFNKNDDKTNLSLMRLYMLQNISLYYNTSVNFINDTLIFTFMFYVNLYQHLQDGCKYRKNKNFENYFLGFFDKKLNNKFTNNTYNYTNETLNNNLKNNNFKNNILQIYNSAKNDFDCENTMKENYCKYLHDSVNLSYYYLYLNDMEIDCLDDYELKYLTSSINNSHYENGNCYCQFFRCLNLSDNEYVKNFKQNVSLIKFNWSNFTISNSCIVNFSSFNNSTEEINVVRLNYKNLTEKLINGNISYLFYYFSNISDNEILHSKLTDEVMVNIKTVVIVYIIILLFIIIVINLLFSHEILKIEEKINKVANFIETYDIDNERKESLKKINDSLVSIDLSDEKPIQSDGNKRKSLVFNSKNVQTKELFKKMKTIKEDDKEDCIYNPEIIKPKFSGFNEKGHDNLNTDKNLNISINFEKSQKFDNNIKQNKHVKSPNFVPSVISKIKNKSKREKDELDEIIEIIRNNKENFFMKINYESAIIHNSQKHKFFENFFKEKITFYEFFIKVEDLLKEKYNEYDYNKFILYEYFELEHYEFNIEGRNFLFKFEEIDENSSDDDFDLNLLLVDKRKEFFCRINDYIQSKEHDNDVNLNENMRKELSSAINYYIDNILTKWLSKINKDKFIKN